MPVPAAARRRLFDGMHRQHAGAQGNTVAQCHIHQSVHGGGADIVVMIGLAAQDAAQGDIPVIRGTCVDREAYGLRQLETSRHVQPVMGGRGLG
jgi:hypothetical protein